MFLLFRGDSCVIVDHGRGIYLRSADGRYIFAIGQPSARSSGCLVPRLVDRLTWDLRTSATGPWPDVVDKLFLQAILLYLYVLLLYTKTPEILKKQIPLWVWYGHLSRAYDNHVSISKLLESCMVAPSAYGVVSPSIGCTMWGTSSSLGVVWSPQPCI